MRNVLWDRYERLFRPGSLLLDVGCGTGIDALFLAEQGIRVVGIDASVAMIARAHSKVHRSPFRALIDLRVLDIRDIGSLPTGAFDGIISAFASLSAVPDLERFGAEGARLLQPRGTMLLHLLNRWSLWEWLGLLHQRRFRDARRLRHQVSRNFVIGDRMVQHDLSRGREAYRRFFATHFRLRRLYGLGVFRPPHTIRRLHPAVVRVLAEVERPLREWPPFVDWGRFFVLELEKRGAGSDATPGARAR